MQFSIVAASVYREAFLFQGSSVKDQLKEGSPRLCGQFVYQSLVG